MPEKFNMESPPFDRLTPEEQHTLRAALDVAYFRAHEVLLQSGKPTDNLHILMKGAVEEISADKAEVFAHYANEDMFDVRGMFEDSVKHHYVALEDTLSYLLPKSVFLDLYNHNGQFAAYFDNNLSRRQALIEMAHQQKNLAEFILTKVEPSIYQPPLLIPADHSLKSVTARLKVQSADAALVELDPADPRLQSAGHMHPYAIVTRTNLLHAVMLDGYSQETSVGDIATFPVLHVDKGDFLFDALILMTRNRIKRVMVCDGNNAVGMLDMTQLLSAFSTHSHVLTLSIARASSVEELAMASNQQKNLVESLLNNGIRTRFIMELISAINEQIIEKAFQLVVPPALHDYCCLIVLGSEGRGEQILKTDQDNALILKDGLQWQQCDKIMQILTHTLQQLGYPLCPGKVMVSNPEWVKSQSGWKQALTEWVDANAPEPMMDVAIMADAHAVAGNAELLLPVKHHLNQLMAGEELRLAEFTRPALRFSLPLTLFGNIKYSREGLDIKQGGIFPIVHGIRALSLEYHIEENNTFTRIETLVKRRVLEQETAENLSEALKLFFRLRLTQQLAHNHSENKLNPSELDRTQRDLLRHGLHVVKKFKQWLGYHYQIRD